MSKHWGGMQKKISDQTDGVCESFLNRSDFRRRIRAAGQED
jgi:hypothetical protein